MDADLQDDPKEIPNFLKKLDEGYEWYQAGNNTDWTALSKTKQANSSTPRPT